MATKKTWKWAKRVSLVVYRKALKAAEKGDWLEVQRLTCTGLDCAFCEVASGPCNLECPAFRICGRKPYMNAYAVRKGHRTPSAGLRHLRLTIAQLEALDV